ncbi:MAG: molecular chaperone DnaJ [Opitutaceae bacterium]|nr:molecular chaperone DnaJ [Opitutaceae bacterium]
MMPDRVAQFEALVARQPENELFRFSLAQALLDAGRGSEAVPHLEFCVQKKADWMLPRILLGKELLRAGQTAAARPLLEAALQLAIEQDHDDPAAELRELLTDL